MPFSDAQKQQFIALLQTKGWRLRDGTISSASGGLWFSDSHFEDWTLAQMREIFTARGDRIARAQIGDWQMASSENKEAAWAADELMRL